MVIVFAQQTESGTNGVLRDINGCNGCNGCHVHGGITRPEERARGVLIEERVTRPGCSHSGQMRGVTSCCKREREDGGYFALNPVHVY